MYHDYGFKLFCFVLFLPYPNRHAELLVPLWVGIFFQNLCADLRKERKNPKLASELHVGVVIKEFLRCYTHCFACEVDLHQRVHQVLSVAVKPEDLPHSIHESIIHCRQQKSKKSTNVCLLRRLKPFNKKQPVSGFTLWQVFSSVDLQGEPCSSQGHSSRPQQVSLDIFFILHTLTLVSLRTKTDQHSAQHHIANMQQHHWYKRP